MQFDHSALFAIGKLLGNPIQVDQDTANKKRLSFARICVEIDITKPPPEEIILVGAKRCSKLDGERSIYCRECKHVGHTSDVCYASGKMERPEKRDYNYNKAALKQKQSGEQGAKGKHEQSSQKPKENDRGTQGRNYAHGMHRSGGKLLEWKVLGNLLTSWKRGRKLRNRSRWARTSWGAVAMISVGSPGTLGDKKRVMGVWARVITRAWT